jgi:hypothetical protein
MCSLHREGGNNVSVPDVRLIAHFFLLNTKPGKQNKKVPGIMSSDTEHT